MPNSTQLRSPRQVDDTARCNFCDSHIFFPGKQKTPSIFFFRFVIAILLVSFSLRFLLRQNELTSCHELEIKTDYGVLRLCSAGRHGGQFDFFEFCAHFRLCFENDDLEVN
jgi:hypothetical protein